MALHDLAARFELRCETIVDVNNGDAIVRVSDLDSRAIGAKIEMFDDALHDIALCEAVVAARRTRAAQPHPTKA